MKKDFRNKQSWKKVLHEIYLIAPNKYIEDGKFNRNNESHVIAKKLNLKSQEFQEAVSFLEEQKLIHITRFVSATPYQTWEITEKGFNVALENEKAKNMENLQLTAGLAASLIAFMTLFNFYYDRIGPNFDIGQWIILALIVIVIIGSGIGLFIVVIPLINKATNWF